MFKTLSTQKLHFRNPQTDFFLNEFQSVKILQHHPCIIVLTAKTQPLISPTILQRPLLIPAYIWHSVCKFYAYMLHALFPAFGDFIFIFCGGVTAPHAGLA